MAAHWQLARTRQPGLPNVRVLAPELARHGWQSTTSVVQVVTDDMPFLVDSVTMAVHRCGLAIELVIHPVLRVMRADGELVGLTSEGAAPDGIAESFLHVEFERVTDERALARVEEAVRVALTDVRVAVTDWPAMEARTREIAGELRRATHADATETADLVDWMADHHFTFLGAADYDASRLAPRDGTILGILRSRPELLGPMAAPDPDQLLALRKANGRRPCTGRSRSTS